MSQIANWIAFGALLITVVMALLALAFKMGGLTNTVKSHSERISDLERRDTADLDGKTALALALTEFKATVLAEMKHLGERFTELKGEFLWLRKGALYEMDQPPAAAAETQELPTIPGQRRRR